MLVRLSEFFEAAAEQAKASETDVGWDLSCDFAEAAATLTDLGEDLHDAADQLRALDRPAKPSWQARVAGYYATAPVPQRTGTPTVTPEASAAAPPPASRPIRTR